jgi:hypothetical protein
MWLLLVFLLSGTAYAVDTCETCKTTMVLDDVSGGLQTNIPSYKLDQSFSPNLRNVFIDGGKIETINGFVTVGSSRVLQRVTGIFPYYQEDGTTKFIVTDSSIVLETADFNSWVFVSTMNPGALTRCLQVRNKMWCGNGLDFWFTWDSSLKNYLNGVSNPLVPKFKYAAYWQNRVFGINSTSDGSSLDWSELKSTNNAQIAPDNFLAWPTANNLSIGRGDGQTSNGIWVKDGQLKICKNNSQYTIFGTNSSSYFDRKDDPQVGCISHDAVVVLDGHSYLFGNNSITEDRRRITDNIQDQIDQVNKETSRVIQNSWEIQSDFSRGNFSFGSTGTTSGFLTIQSNQSGLALTGNGRYFLNTFQSAATDLVELSQATPASAFGSVNSSLASPIQNSFYGNFRQLLISVNSKSGCDASVKLKVTVKNVGTNETATSEGYVPEVTQLKSVPFGDGNINGDDVIVGSTTWSGYQINNSSMQIKFELTGANAGCFFNVYSPTGAGTSDITFTPATTVQFLSEVSTLNSITAWGNFESRYNTNGGKVDYFTRTSTSSVNISTQIWVHQTPGTIINAPLINNYIQWSATITAVSTITPSNIDNVTIDHVEGAGALERPFAIDWGNRLWVGVSTESSGNFSKIFVKSIITNRNPEAWMPIEGINVKCFAKDGERTLYAGSASTGIVYRLDYGTNFDGRPIDSLYETPESWFGDPFVEKNLFDYVLFADKESGNFLTLGTSFNGSEYTDESVSLDGTGRAIKVINKPQLHGHYFKWRFKNSQLDKKLNITNFGATNEVTKIKVFRE